MPDEIDSILDSLVAAKAPKVARTASGDSIRQITPHGAWGYPRKRKTGIKPHQGIDIAGGEMNVPYGVAAPGRVVFAGPRGAYGNLIEVEHEMPDGRKVKSRFGHNSQILVKAGDIVQPGQPIGKIGATGNANGAHIHYEWWEKNRSVNPATVKDALYPVRQSPW